MLDEEASIWADLILRAVDGDDLSNLRRYPEGETGDPNLYATERDLAREREFDLQFQAWLSARKSMIH